MTKVNWCNGDVSTLIRGGDEQPGPCVTRVSIKDGLDSREYGVHTMKIAAAIGTSFLGLLLGATVHGYAQPGPQGSSHKQQGNEGQKEHGRSSEHVDKHEEKGPKQRQAHAPEHMREADRYEHDNRSKDVWQDHRAQHWQKEHRTWHERGGYRGYRIPDDRFRAHFGRQHWFRVHSAPVLVVGGYPRFRYGGFWFSVVDPWPEYWSRTWYETDDIYVDYVDDGYYMYNRRHPGVAIAINVSF